ncbi:MAG: acyl-CoA thioesterase [Halobacteriales archaeon]|nr:acyl-CoA thioesterase [Halobacteriales archaeon]
MPTVLDTYLENRHIIQPNQTNNLDTAHGGVVMSLMDNVGAMSAMRFASEACVTASVDSIDFLQPVPRGAIAVVESWVYDAGRTSVQVRLRVDKEDAQTGERQRTTDSSFTFVAVDESGSPTEVPSLEVETERGEELRRLGLEEG